MTRETAPAETWAPGTWKPITGYAGYEASDRGQVRSVDRVVNGRRYRGQVLAVRAQARGGYLLVNVRDDNGRVRTRTVHGLVMLAHEGPCPPGMVIRHWNDRPDDNRWAPGGEDGCRSGAGNLVYGTPPENEADKRRNKRKRRWWHKITRRM